MNKIRAIMVEDERASRETLRNYLGKYCPNVELIGEAGGVEEGRKLVMELSPDLLFLDVEMPFGNGFDLIETLPGLKMEIIFITAYSDYAIKALNISASYYLLKPIDIDELLAAVAKVEENINSKDPNERLAVLLNNLKGPQAKEMKILLPTLDGFDVVLAGDIIRARANDNLTDLFLVSGERKVICRTLKFFDETLSDHGFLRVHKSHLINMDHVRSYKKGNGGVAIMADGSEVDISVRKKSDFLDKVSRRFGG